MRKLGRKLTSALLTPALLVSVLPIGAAPAQAADTAGAFEVTGGTSGTDYSYSNGVLTVNDGASITISMASEATKSTSDRIVVNGNAKITLNGVNITPVDAGTDDGYSGIDLASGATLNITLQSGSSNVINGGTSITGAPGPGIHVPESSTLIIGGNGSLEVKGASRDSEAAVGIGGNGSASQAGEACGNVIILGGTITVHGGTPKYTGRIPVDIGGGNSDAGKGGDCKTVIILASVNSDEDLKIGGGDGARGNGSNGQGIRPVSGQENTYMVWANVTLPCDITIPHEATVTIPNGASLIVPSGTKLTNNGTIVKQQGGTFTNNGTLDGNPLGHPSTVTVTVSGDRVTGNSGQYTAAYGTTATLTATITGNNQPASDGTVTFDRGAASEENEINETPVNVSDGTATTTVSLSGENWTPNADNDAYTITAVYTPGESNQLRPGNGKSSLTIQPKTLTASLGGTLTKTYSGNADAPEGIKLELDGVVSGENMSASSESISYDDGNVGIGKTITASDIKLNGDDAGNYTLGTNTTITTDAGVIIAAEITGSVTISGTPTVGGTLKATYSGGNATEISYQWYRGNEAISGATETSYTLTADDAGKSVSVCVTASGNYSGSVESTPVTVNKTEQSAPETGTGYKIDYVAETISAENGYELAATKGANDGSASLSVTPGTDVYIRLAETATAYASDWTLVDVPARPAAPANVSGGTEQISGVDSSMEYRAASSTNWTRCTGASILSLSDGDYEVRIAATESAFASEAVQVHVSPYTGRFSYEISTSVGDNGTISVDRYATEGERVTITVSPDDAYKLDDLSVTAHGKDVELTDNGDGTYTFTMPSGDVKISATFAEDPDWTEPEEPATDVSEIFIDVAPNAWYKDAVQYAYDNGLMTGTSDTEFAPEATTTRAMIVSILARLENVTSAEAAGFADVSADDWYATAVNWAA
ncbi:MAG: YDG domain-containing protein, partial [Peptococcaceae bacterium]|nr:YDG domain-containing protein [Peptococcaceae bacterium]